ncbi:MAG: tetratricopeptide repeat protein [Candidatus Latescibacteria bacterium]|nr:tetratricopeptide repeat protein [Candidatus Latescibacterota bacterium]
MFPNWLGRHYLSGTLIGVLVFVVYAGSLDNAFQYDDIHSIVENSHLRALGNIPAFFYQPEMFSADPRNAMYRPLVLVSYALNHALSGYEVWSYHLFNLGVHLGASWLLWALVCQLGGTRLEALLAGLLFALHPLASEPVNYISSRSESLCAFFFLLAFLGYVRGGRRWLGVSLGAFAGALLAKSVGLALLLVLLLYDFLFKRGEVNWERIRRRHSLFWLAGLAYLAGIWGAIDTAVVSHPVRSMAVQYLTQVKAALYYLKLLWMPQGLSVEHQFSLAGSLVDGPVLAALLCLGTAGALLLQRNAKETLFWAAWAGLTLLPSSAVPLNVLVNEHRLYLPAAAFAVLLSRVLVGLVARRGRVGGILVAVWLGSYGGLSWQRTQVWQSPEALWQDALRKGPHMPRPHLYVGDCHQQAGRHEEALREYALVRTVYPALLSAGDQLVSYNNQGTAYLALGRHAEAVESYRRALAIDPTYAKAREALDALVALQEQEWDPTAHALHKKGLMMLIENRLGEAVPALEESLRRQPRLETYLALGMAWEKKGDAEKARWAYTSLRTLAPGSSFARTAEEKLKQLEGKK